MQGTDNSRDKKCGLNLPEQLHNIVEIYPSIPIEIKRTDRFIRRNPLHLVEHEHHIVEVLAVVGIQVFE